MPGGGTFQPDAHDQRPAFGGEVCGCKIRSQQRGNLGDAVGPIDINADLRPAQHIGCPEIRAEDPTVPRFDQCDAFRPGLVRVAALDVAGKHHVRAFVQHLPGMDVAERPVVVALCHQRLDTARRIGLVLATIFGRGVQHADVEPARERWRIGGGEVFRHRAVGKRAAVDGHAERIQRHRLGLERREHMHLFGEFQVAADHGGGVVVAADDETRAPETRISPAKNRPVLKSRQSAS